MEQIGQQMLPCNGIIEAFNQRHNLAFPTAVASHNCHCLHNYGAHCEPHARIVNCCSVHVVPFCQRWTGSTVNVSTSSTKLPFMKCSHQTKKMRTHGFPALDKSSLMSFQFQVRCLAQICKRSLFLRKGKFIRLKTCRVGYEPSSADSDENSWNTKRRKC